MKFNVKWLLHNVLCHPVAGVLWFLGFEKLGDKVHDLFGDSI